MKDEHMTGFWRDATEFFVIPEFLVIAILGPIRLNGQITQMSWSNAESSTGCTFFNELKRFGVSQEAGLHFYRAVAS